MQTETKPLLEGWIPEEDRVASIVERYMNLRASKEGSLLGLLVKLGYDENEIIDHMKNSDIVNEIYKNTGIEYSEFKTKLLGYMTEKLFNEFIGKSYINKNNMLYTYDGGATGYSYSNTTAEYLSSSNGIFKYKINTVCKEVELIETCVYEVEITRGENDNWVVAKCEYIEHSINEKNEKDTAQSNNNENVESENNIQNTSKTEEIAKELFEKGSKLIRDIEASELCGYDYVQGSRDVDRNGKRYLNTGTLYSDAEKKYAEVFTGKALEEYLESRFLNIDGYLYVSIGGATGCGITDIKLEENSKSNDEITYIVIYNHIYIDDSMSDEETCEMTIKSVDGEYRISSTNYWNFM